VLQIDFEPEENTAKTSQAYARLTNPTSGAEVDPKP